MKNFILLLLLVQLSVLCYGQTTIVTYAYDDSGNRTSRTLTVSKSLLIPKDSILVDTVKINEQLGEKSITVYPNPVREEVNVEINGYDENVKGSIILIDQSGRTLINQPYISSRNTYNLTRYAKGIYFMVIRIGTSKTQYTIIRN
jgi:hypothetical protein